MVIRLHKSFCHSRNLLLLYVNDQHIDLRNMDTSVSESLEYLITRRELTEDLLAQLEKWLSDYVDHHVLESDYNDPGPVAETPKRGIFKEAIKWLQKGVGLSKSSQK